MNIRESLLEEKVQSKTKALEIAAYATSTPARFKQLMACFLHNEYRLAQRAAWSVSWAARKKPAFITPYIKDLAAQLGRKDIHLAVIRNSLRILQETHIPEIYQGEVMQQCFALVEEPATPVAIKAFALTTLGNLASQYPDIIPELTTLIELQLPHETAAFHQRAKRVLQALSKLPAHKQAIKASK